MTPTAASPRPPSRVRRRAAAAAGATALTLLSTAVVAPALTSPAVARAIPATAPAVSTAVVASGLSNPRGLAVGRGGSLYIAVAGSGAGDGAVMRVADATSGSPSLPVPLLSGLPSVGDPHGAPPGVASTGPVAVAYRHGRLSVQVGLSPVAGDPRLGSLLRVGPRGGVHQVANVGAADFAWSADHLELNPQFPDANPNAVVTVGRRSYVVDAGANTLSVVDSRGRVRVLRFFGTPAGSPTNAVPTCIARDKDGSLYVGELLGGQFAPGGARVWKVSVHGRHVSARVFASGLTTIQGCAFGADGHLYVTEFQTGGLNLEPGGSPVGDVVRLDRHGNATALHVPGLLWPSGLAAARDGSLFVSNCSIAPATGFGPCVAGGQVVRVRP